MHFIEKHSRDIDFVTSTEQKNHILSKYLLDKDLLLRTDPFDQKVILKKILQGGDRILVYLPPETMFSFQQNVQLFKMLANYIHLDCDVIRQVDNTTVLLQVNKLAIAKKNRVNTRYPLEAEIAYATNIITSKLLIDANMLSIPNLVRVNFEDYENRLAEASEGEIHIDVFHSELEYKYSVVKESKKYIWIPDTQDKNSYLSNKVDQINYAEEVDNEIEFAMKKYKAEHITSELILPILYTNHYEEKVPLGYILVQNKGKNESEAILAEYKFLREEIAIRIKESNTVKTTDRFQILEVSRDGLKMRITNPRLIETLKKHDKFVFDIYFKMQAPFTVSGQIRWMSMDEGNEKMDLGVELIGKSSLPGERERYYNNIELFRNGKV